MGEMISLGFPRGVEGNLKPFKHAMDELIGVASNPLEQILIKRNDYQDDRGTKENSSVDKLDRIIEILLSLAKKDKEELKIYLKDREIARALKELGVVFE